MKKYTITIEEMISEHFVIEANTAEEAMALAEDGYYAGKYVLAPGNLVAKQMAISSPADETTEWTEF
ncbi:MAG: DpnD/PcfM family protein [Christensenellales bacterium]